MKSLNKVATLNIVSTILVQGISFFTIPIFSKMLGAEQYGMYSGFVSWVGILSCIMGAQVAVSLGTGRYEFKDDYFVFRNSVLLFGTFICTGVIGFTVLFIKPICLYLDYSYEMLILLLLWALNNYVIEFVQKACIYEKKPEMNLLISLVLSVTTVVLSVFLIRQFPQNRSYLGRIYGAVIPGGVLALIIWLVVFMKNPGKLQKNYCKYSIVAGVPVVFHLLAHNVLSQSDRIMMQKFGISNSEIGIYSLFYSFVAIMSIILGALNNSWCPFYFDDLEKECYDKLKGKCRNYIELFTVLVIGFLLLSREVSCFYADSEFWEGINIIPILVLSVFFSFMYQFPVNFEFFYRKNHIIAIGTAVTAVVNISLNAIMIPKWGMYGATLATAVSYGILFIAHYLNVRYMKEGKFHLRIVAFVPSLVVIGITIVLFYVLADFWYVRWGLGMVVGICELIKIVRRRTIF